PPGRSTGRSSASAPGPGSPPACRRTKAARCTAGPRAPAGSTRPTPPPAPGHPPPRRAARPPRRAPRTTPAPPPPPPPLPPARPRHLRPGIRLRDEQRGHRGERHAPRPRPRPPPPPGGPAAHTAHRRIHPPAVPAHDIHAHICSFGFHPLGITRVSPYHLRHTRLRPGSARTLSSPTGTGQWVPPPYLHLRTGTRLSFRRIYEGGPATWPLAPARRSPDHSHVGIARHPAGRPLGADRHFRPADLRRLAPDAPRRSVRPERPARRPHHRVLRGPDLDLRRRFRDPEPRERMAHPGLRRRLRVRLRGRALDRGKARHRPLLGPDHLDPRRRGTRRGPPRTRVRRHRVRRSRTGWPRRDRIHGAPPPPGPGA